MLKFQKSLHICLVRLYICICFGQSISSSHSLTLTNGGSPCAIGVTVDLAHWPACSPIVFGETWMTTGQYTPGYVANLKSKVDPNYILDLEQNCDYYHVFCPDVSKAPFELEIEPLHPSYYLCGVTMMDAALVRRHAARIQFLPAPWARIAGDVYFNGSDYDLTDDDADVIRDITIGNTSNISVPSWRYFDDKYVFANILEPYQEASLPLNKVDVPSSGNAGVFQAVKMGDVNFSCNCENYNPTSSRFKPALNMAQPIAKNKVEDRASVSGKPYFTVLSDEVRSEMKRVDIPVRLAADGDLFAMQGAFWFDPEVFDLVGITPNEKVRIDAKSFNTQLANQGEIRFAWAGDGVFYLPSSALLFTVSLRLKPGAAMPHGALLRTYTQNIPSLAYKADEVETPVYLDWRGSDHGMGIDWTVMPNPVTTAVQIWVYSQADSEAPLRLLDATGKVLDTQVITLQTGENSLSFPVSDLPSGVYFLSLKVNGATLQKRLVKL